MNWASSAPGLVLLVKLLCLHSSQLMNPTGKRGNLAPVYSTRFHIRPARDVEKREQRAVAYPSLRLRLKRFVREPCTNDYCRHELFVGVGGGVGVKRG